MSRLDAARLTGSVRLAYRLPSLHKISRPHLPPSQDENTSSTILVTHDKMVQSMKRSKRAQKATSPSPSLSVPDSSDAEISEHQHGSRKRRKLSEDEAGEEEDESSGEEEYQLGDSSEQSGDEVNDEEEESEIDEDSDENVELAPKSQISRAPARSPLSRVHGKNGGTTRNGGTAFPGAKQGKDHSTFASMNLAPWLVGSLASMEIKRPTGVQKACIPEIMKGRDCIGISKTGTGKTVTFAAPILQKWAEDPCAIFAVVLT